MGVRETDPLSQLSLPPGFRFYPTDEELLVKYLVRKVAGYNFPLQIIGDIDLYKFDPWDLPSKAMFGEKEWYFFSPRDRKYPNGSRPNRVAGSGYWKATGTDKIIMTEGRKVGIKKALVFYVGKAPKGTKTNWIMHEYRLSEPPRKNGSARLDDWVLCRIYKKNSGGQKPVMSSMSSKEYSHGSSSSCSSQYEDMLESIPEMDARFFPGKSFQQEDQKPINLQQLGSGTFDWATLAGLTPLSELSQAQQVPAQQMNNNINMNVQNDMFASVFNQVGASGNVADEEVQSGIRNLQRMDNAGAGYFQQNMNGFVPMMSNSTDPFRVRYPNQPGGSGTLGFRQ